MSKRRLVTADDRRNFAAAYAAGKSTHQIARENGWGRFAVREALRVLGVVMRSSGERQQRIHPLDEGFFATIDTPAKAYLLGFIATDGCVRCGALTFGLKRQDRDHLEKIRAALSTTAPVFNYEATCGHKRVPASGLSINSKRLLADLARHGIHPRKSHTVKPWDGPADLLPAYWLGVLDGDGSIHESRRDKNWRVSLVGNPAMVNGFVRFVRDRLGISPNKPEVRGPSVIVTYRKLPELHLLLRLLYANAPLCLDRKRERADAVLARQPRCVYHDWSQYTEEDLQELHRIHGSWEKVAAHFGMTRSAITALRWARRKRARL